MAQSNTDPQTVQYRLREQVPDEWAVRIRERFVASDHRTEVVFEAGAARIFVRPVSVDGMVSWRVTGDSPTLSGGCLRIAVPDDHGGPLGLDECLDHAVAVALRYSECGSLL
jgi:hypothetical protein